MITCSPSRYQFQSNVYILCHGHGSVCTEQRTSDLISPVLHFSPPRFTSNQKVNILSEDHEMKIVRIKKNKQKKGYLYNKKRKKIDVAHVRHMNQTSIFVAYLVQFLHCRIRASFLLYPWGSFSFLHSSKFLILDIF